MKKIVFLLLVALCFPWTMMAQGVNDDLYYVPSKQKEEQKREEKKAPARETVIVERKAPNATTVVRSGTAVVVKDRKGNRRDVDEYNRRYESRENDFVMEGDTLFIEEKSVPDPEGEWIGGFDGSADDYEYATRIIRFRNPRFAISISSPYYWDIVYGLNSWEWNIFTDGMYAYAFPTFTNNLWWDWRYNSHAGRYPYYGYGWNSFYGPNWGFGWGGIYGGGWYAWGGHHHHNHWWGNGHWGGGHWGGGGRPAVYDTYTRRGGNSERSLYGSASQTRRGESSSTRVNTGTTRNRGTSIYQRTSPGRVVGTRPGAETRTNAADTRRSIYTRPSSTRTGVSGGSTGTRGSSTPTYSEGGRKSVNRNSGTYNRGSSTTNTRSYSNDNNRRSSTPNSSTRSYSPTNSGSSRSYSTGSGGGGSSRSSGGGGGGSSRSRR